LNNENNHGLLATGDWLHPAAGAHEHRMRTPTLFIDVHAERPATRAWLAGLSNGGDEGLL